KRVFQVMMGGAVGTFSSMPEIGIEVQKRVAELVGMYPMAVPSRNINSHKVEYMMNLSLLANICHKIAEEVYSTTLEEIDEVSVKEQLEAVQCHIKSTQNLLKELLPIHKSFTPFLPLACIQQ